MSVTFLGIRNVGGAAAKSNATMSWLINVQQVEDGNASRMNPWSLGFLTNFAGWKFTVDPSALQGSFTFGDVKALQIGIQRVQNVYIAANNQYRSGRVIVILRSSHEIFAFAPKRVIGEDMSIAGVFTPMESETVIVPVTGIYPGVIDVYIEQNQVNGAAGIPAEESCTIVAYNYDVQSVGAM